LSNNNHFNSVAGVILAGGMSRRMGEDKAQVNLNNLSLLQRAKALLTELGCSPIYISSNELDGAIKDNFISFGPVAGIEACLSEVIKQKSANRLVVIPVDMPLLTAEILTTLVTNTDDDRVGHFNYQQFPMVLPATTDVHNSIAAALGATEQQSGLSIKKLFQLLKSRTIAGNFDDKIEFNNCNTPEELEQVRVILKK